MEREKLLKLLVPLLVQESGATQSDAKSVLATYSTDDLHRYYYKAVNGGRLKSDSTPARATTPAPSATWADVEQEKADHELGLAKIRSDADRKLTDLEMDAALEYEKFIMAKEQAEAPQREAQLRRDRETFRDAYATLRQFGDTQANFQLVREVLGPGFTVFDIRNALSANAVQLSAPTEQEQQAWAQEDTERRNDHLLNADPITLREEVRREAEARRTQQQQQEVKAADEARRERDAARQFPLLPNERLGKALDASYIKRASVEELKFLIRRYGETAVTARLRGQG